MCNQKYKASRRGIVIRQKSSDLKEYTKAIILFIAAVAVGLAVFFACAQYSISENSQDTIRTTVTRQSEHLRSILELHYQYLQIMADQVAETDDITSRENMELIANLHEYTDLELSAIIEPDGTSHYDNGAVKNVAHRRYFQEAMSGQQALSDPLESSVDQETRVVLGVPIVRDGEVRGVLGASYNVTALSRLMFNDTFNGIGYSLIVTQDGEIIAYDGQPAYHEISYGDNFFEFYSDKKIMENTSLADVQADFREEKAGLFRMRNEQGDRSSEQYLSYVPLGMNNWMICYMLPLSAAVQPYRFFTRYELIFMIAFCILVVLLFAYMIKKSGQKNRELIRASQTDGLTGLYNKKVTEERINAALQERPEAMHAFLILDLDRFKEVNDGFGHAAGDAVLRCFAGLLRNYFRENDVVGRIGGDEFIVFMKNVDSKESVQNRVSALVQKIGELEFADMPEHITSSIGVAFAPEHGDCYMDLYKTADDALYETKHHGRNGYTVSLQMCEQTESKTGQGSGQI